ncbi:unnamed protein product [Lupinus luteus]|uniref:Uncharacterized protein n=1 Tax=Lupinus luteus TaxID=3873 RepID=A0AAV1WAV7_LUPLU
MDFACNTSHRIHSAHFAHLMIPSGLLYNCNVTWVTFHSSYDFSKYRTKPQTNGYDMKVDEAVLSEGDDVEGYTFLIDLGGERATLIFNGQDTSFLWEMHDINN